MRAIVEWRAVNGTRRIVIILRGGLEYPFFGTRGNIQRHHGIGVVCLRFGEILRGADQHLVTCSINQRGGPDGRTARPPFARVALLHLGLGSGVVGPHLAAIGGIQHGQQAMAETAGRLNRRQRHLITGNRHIHPAIVILHAAGNHRIVFVDAVNRQPAGIAGKLRPHRLAGHRIQRYHFCMTGADNHQPLAQCRLIHQQYRGTADFTKLFRWLVIPVGTAGLTIQRIGLVDAGIIQHVFGCRRRTPANLLALIHHGKLQRQVGDIAAVNAGRHITGIVDIHAKTAGHNSRWRQGIQLGSTIRQRGFRHTENFLDQRATQLAVKIAARQQPGHRHNNKRFVLHMVYTSVGNQA